MPKLRRSDVIEKIVRQPLNENQKKVADFRNGKACVCAVAGSGKTHSVCSRIANMVQEGINPKKILAVTFSVKAAEEMEKRIKLLGCPIRTKTGGEGVRIGTLHSLALEIIRDDSEWKKLEVDQKEQGRLILKEIVGWKCMNWQGVDITSVEHYIAHCRNELVDPDAATHFDERYVQAYTAYHHKMLQAGLLAFDDMLFFAVKHLRSNRDARDRWNKRYDHTIIDEFQDTNRAQLEMCLILSEGCKSYMVVGDDDQCQPPETMIKVKSKYWGEYEWVSISSLKVGNRVCVYNRPSQKATGTRAVTEISSRYFNGNLHSIQVGGNTTKATPNHKFLVRWTDRSDTNIWAVYLMFRSDMGYRIGCCQVYNSEGAFHLGMRGRLEKADGIWILETHFDKQKARTREVILSINFGLPQVTFEGDGSILSKEAISEIYSTIDTYSAGKKCLEEYGMFENLPLWPLPLTKNSNQGGKQRGTIFRCYAANIIPGIMSIPNEHGDWCDVESNESAPYSGMVYSLNVAEFHNYIADGMVTCNSIYQWRGAHPEFMMGFSREATLITLDINYRSTPSIIKAANSVIAFNQNRILKSAKPNGVSDILPEFCPVTNPDEEATMVLEKMNLQREEKKEWKDFTILYRTNAQSRAFEEVFIQKGVPYQIIGGWDFWKRKEIHDVMSYLKLSVRDDDEAALRVMNKPHRFLGAKTMEKVKTEAKSKNMGVMDIIRSMANGNYQDIRSQQILALKEFLCCVDQVRNLAKQNAEPHQILGYVIDQMGYLEWLLKDEGSDNPENSRTSNLRELQRTSMRFKTANEMIQYLDDLAKEKRKKKVDRNLVTLMSIHRSKGLEFPVVFLVGASEEILPHARNENLEEERRLFYVAITRAREKLYVSSPREIIAGGKIKELNVSRFVFEAGLAVGVP